MLLQDDTPAIPDDFYYNLDDHMSKAVITDESGLPGDLLTLQYVIFIIRSFFSTLCKLPEWQLFRIYA